MKTLVVTDKESISDHIEAVLKPHGFDFIHYRNPLKAMDNIEEISPDIVIFNAEDFPRHWKPFIRLLREYKSKDECIFVLLKGETFDIDEAAKATFLGVNGVIREELDDPGELQVIEDILSRHLSIRETRIDKRYFPRSFDDIEFIFTVPFSLNLVTGVVIDIAPDSLCFRPDFPPAVQNIKNGSDLENCTLKIGDTLFSCAVHVVRNTGNLAFKFNCLAPEKKNIIIDYINDHTARELDDLKHPSDRAV